MLGCFDHCEQCDGHKDYLDVCVCHATDAWSTFENNTKKYDVHVCSGVSDAE